MSRNVKRLALFVAAALLSTVGPGQASDDTLKVWWERWPAPAVEEISGGKLRVGDKITKANVEFVREYMPEAFYRHTLDGAEWEIVPTTPGHKLVLPSMLKATKDNLGKAVQAADGTLSTKEGAPWVGGFPFPEAKTGLEIMANRFFRRPDTVWGREKSYWITREGRTYRRIRLEIAIENTIGRVCDPPIPYLSDHEDELSRELIWLQDPYDVRGTALLSMIPLNQSRYPEAWIYLPAFRRNLRLSSGQRYDSTDGSDLRAGDIDTFSDPLGLWTFKIIGRKFLFATLVGADTQAGRDVPIDRDLPLINGKYPVDAKLELRDTYILEALPKDARHLYSKKHLFIDVATWYSWLGQFYDRQGQLMTGYSVWDFRGESRCGNQNFISLTHIHNFNTGHTTMLHIPEVAYNDPEKVNYKLFTLKHLVTQAR